eukprot:TRINITY_DN5460_c0_g1_i1.p1 TRINITY_DN5460_c0_g1~~TRINITY_DN5460_c0_g1_i1.p1  ORF type:complete len:1139 (-),score=213.12 TRINITY_DN5460_c0_g1_i1:326-3742(-)
MKRPNAIAESERDLLRRPPPCYSNILAGAKTICQLAGSQMRYWEGICWIPLKEADLHDAIAHVCKYFDCPLASLEHCRLALRGKRIIFVLDDVSNRADATQLITAVDLSAGSVILSLSALNDASNGTDVPYLLTVPFGLEPWSFQPQHHISQRSCIITALQHAMALSGDYPNLHGSVSIPLVGTQQHLGFALWNAVLSNIPSSAPIGKRLRYGTDDLPDEEISANQEISNIITPSDMQLPESDESIYLSNGKRERDEAAMLDEEDSASPANVADFPLQQTPCKRALVAPSDSITRVPEPSPEFLMLADSIGANILEGQPQMPMEGSPANLDVMRVLCRNAAAATRNSRCHIAARATRAGNSDHMNSLAVCSLREQDLRFKLNRARDHFVAMGQIVALSFVFLVQVTLDTLVDGMGSRMYNKLFSLGVYVYHKRHLLCAEENQTTMTELQHKVQQLFPEAATRHAPWPVCYKRLFHVCFESVTAVSKSTNQLIELVVEAKKHSGALLKTPVSQLAALPPAVPMDCDTKKASVSLSLLDLDDDVFCILGEYLAKHDPLTLATFTLTSKNVCRAIKNGLRYLDTAALSIPAKLQAMFAVGFPNLHSLRIACVPPNIIGCLLWKLPLLETLVLTAVPVTKPFEKEMFSEVLKRLCGARAVASASLKKLTLTCAIATVPYLRELEVQCPNVEEFSISEVSQSVSLLSEPVVQLCRMWPKLRVLNILRCALSKDCVMALSQKAGLEVLNIADSLAQNGEVLALLTKGPLRLTLRELNISRLCNMNNGCLRAMLSAGLPQLTTLHMSYLSGVSDDGLLAVSCVSATLTDLNISGDVSFSAECVNGVILNCPKLQKFVAGPNKNMSDDTLLALANTCRDLQVVRLRQCQACSKSIAALRINCPKLKELSLTENCKLTDASLRSLPALESLDISAAGGRISHLGICEYLTQNGKQLRYLDLTSVSSTNSDAILVAVGENCVYLHTLRVQSEWLTTKALVTLSQLCYLSKLESVMSSKPQRPLSREPQIPFANHPPVSLSDASRMWQRYLTECELFVKSKALPSLKFDLSGSKEQQAHKELVARNIADRLRYQEFLASSIQAERLNAGASLIDDAGTYDTAVLVKEMEGKSPAHKLFFMARSGAAMIN